MTVPCQKEEEFKLMAVKIALVEQTTENQALALTKLATSMDAMTKEVGKLRTWWIVGIAIISGAMFATTPGVASAGLKLVLSLIK